MSISTKNIGEKITNKYIKFHDGEFKYFDKEAKVNVIVPLPLRFVVIDELSTVTGWDDASQSSIWSNEVKSTVKEELFVRSFKGGEIATGIYRDIKDKVGNAGGRYTKSVYALWNNELVNFQFSGACNSSWIEATNDNKNKTDTVMVQELLDGKKGKTVYKIPKFVFVENDETEYQKAVELDSVLQEYLQNKKKTRLETQEEASSATNAVMAELHAPIPTLDIPMIKYQSNINPEDLPF